MSKVKNIFEHTDCILEEMLMKYVSDKLSPAEKHEVEKHLIDCDMCSDAVEGLQRIGDKKKISNITAELNQKIQTRIDTNEEKKAGKIIFLQQYRTQLAVAASIAVLIGLIWFFRSNSMKELDPISSEKIFADKFEPYKSDKDESKESSNTPVSEAPALNKVDKESSERAKGDREPLHNAAAEDKKTDLKQIEFASKLSKEGTNAEEGYYRATDNKKSAVPATAAPKADAVVRDESVALDKNEEADQKATAPKEAMPTKTVPAASAGASGNAALAFEKNKANDNRNVQEEAESKQQNTEVMALQTKSKSGKDRSKGKKSGEVQTAQSQPESTPVTISNAMGSQTDIVLADSVSAGLTTTSTTGADDADIAMKKYDQKDYAGATEDFEKTLAKDPNNYNALFYSAVSYMSTGQTDKAITNLNKVLEKKDGEFYDAAQWYLSLAYIKKSDTQNARRNLMELQKNSKSKYQKQADETLKEMQK
jgi:hypothetical protein